MKGLLLKELLIIRPYLKSYALVFAAYMLISLTGSSSMFASMIAVILFVLPISGFTIDEMAHWDKFAAVLPGGRRRVVAAKYQSLLVILACALVLSCAANLLVYFFGRNQSSTLPELLLTSVSYAAGGLLLNSVLFPFLFKFGSQKSRIIMIGIFALFFAGLAILGIGLPELDVFSRVSPWMLGAAGVVFLAAAVLLSYNISCSIYDKKEF